MTIPSNYEINVATKPEPNAKYGRHFCRIELGGCLPEEARLRFNIMNPTTFRVEYYNVETGEIVSSHI